ncbi:MAG: EamA family transporter [Chloroflexi bacterium]|nr:EamA family transporter [Chloroflexota bacterium]MQC26395.1 EamA family transporter [Chloroflexota bacterium]
MTNKQADPNQRLDPGGLLHLAVVYVVWSSTYLAIRLAVREGAGFPPFTLGFMRALVGGIVLIVWAGLRGGRLRITSREAGLLAASGLLLWVGGNGLVTFAEQRADSGLAALMVAAAPIWAAILEAIIDRKLPTRQLSFSLFIGFVGIGVLTVPELASGVRADSIAMLALVGATITWSAGSVLQARKPVTLSNRASASYQMLFGAVGFAIVALLVGEPAPTPTREAWLAYSYLVVFGSVIAFTSYVTVLRVLPTRIVMTYAYVNPVLAVLLGWFFLREPITIWTVAGSLFVLIGVAGVFREQRPKANRATRG